MDQKILVVDYEKCAGCRICELACSYHHEDGFNPEKSRIHVVTLKRKGADIPVVCEQCDEPICSSVCPTGALTKNLNTGAMLINNDLCIGCAKCVKKCPYGGPSLDRKQRKILICDLCGGDPACVKFCPTQTLRYVPYDNSALKVKRGKAQKAMQALHESVTSRYIKVAKQRKTRYRDNGGEIIG